MNAPRPDVPIEGYYKRRLVKGGPWVAVSIHFRASQPDRSPMWVCTQAGEYVDLDDVWPDCSGEPITEDEYSYLESVRQWAVSHDPNDPYAKPRERIDLTAMPPIKW